METQTFDILFFEMKAVSADLAMSNELIFINEIPYAKQVMNKYCYLEDDVHLSLLCLC